jgi:predicted methyltransferase
VTEAQVIALAEAAGFKLEEKSEINANPKDTRDHPNGVWSLPPVLRGGDVDREKFVAIGESDRMTLRFVKPAAQPAQPAAEGEATGEGDPEGEASAES